MVWPTKPNIEPHGLDIGGMRWNPPASGGVGLLGVRETGVGGPGRAMMRLPREGAVWPAKPNIEPHGLDIDGTGWKPPAGGGVGLLGARETGVGGLGGPRCDYRERGWFG